jgi:RNA polymerase sigma-70 factor (ECF subfamily)
MAAVARVADGALVARAANGDVEAYEQLVRRHQLPVYRHCLNMLGDEGDAAETAQDVFFTVWRSLTKFRGESELSTWLYRVATNRCLNVLRQRKVPTLPLVDQPSSHGLPEGEFERKQIDERINQAIASLTPEQRVALLLREVEGLNYEQIARVLGISLAAVKGRLNRARVEIALAMEVHDG